jgi:hypothetical protein
MMHRLRTARLRGPTDHVLELTPLAYEFPDSTEDYDANWVIVRMVASDGERRWLAEDPCFLTWDLFSLVFWIRGLAEGADGLLDCYSALEPNLQFERLGKGDATRLTAYFSQEYRPPVGDAEITFTPGADGLRRFADELAAALLDFPVRVPAGRNAARFWVNDLGLRGEAVQPIK